MWLKAWLALPLIILSPTLSEEGCESTETPTPLPTPTELPGTPTPSEVSDFAQFEQLLEAVSEANTDLEKQGLVDAFFYQIAYSGGFPIVHEGTHTFVTQGNNLSSPIRVAGDFNDWDAEEFPLDQSPSFDLFYTTITLDGAPDRSLYKFVGRQGGSDSYIADSHARRFQYDSFGQYSLIDGGDEASHIERYPLYQSDKLPSPRDLLLYIPAGYEGGSDDLPTLYMHDGQNLYDPNAFWGGWQADDVADQMIQDGDIEPLFLVGLANSFDRMEEYTQAEDFVPSAGGNVGGDGELYAALLVEEIIPFVEDRYRASSNRQERGVLGSSLGGLISYYIGWLHPEQFYYVGGMSSTFGWGKINLDNETVIEMLDRTEKRDQLFYIDSGGGAVGSCENDTDGDGIWDDNASAGDNYCETLQMKSVLESKGYVEGVDLFYQFAPGAEHNEAEWNKRMDEALDAFVGI